MTKTLYRPARPAAYRNPGYAPAPMKEGVPMSRQVRRQTDRRRFKMPVGMSQKRWHRFLGIGKS